MKIKAVSYRESELLDSYRESLKNVGIYLEISFGLFDHKIIPGLSRTGVSHVLITANFQHLLLFLNVCKQTFHISLVRISQKVEIVLL